MRLLLIEDDFEIADFLQRGLRDEGYDVRHAPTAAAGMAALNGGPFQVVLLDLMLPDGHGSDVCRTIREKGLLTPILMLTALDALDDKVQGLRAGADDYLCKPFEFEELLARIEALIRRETKFAANDPVLRLGDLTLDTEKIRVWRGEKEIILTSKEFAVLEYLMRHPEKVFSRDALLSAVWGAQDDTVTNVVEVCIGRLRKKIDNDGARALIHTIRGRGYKAGAVPGSG